MGTDFLPQIQKYYQGERFESLLLALSGSLCLVLCLCLWRWAAAASLGRGLMFSLFSLAVFLLGAGVFLLGSQFWEGVAVGLIVIGAAGHVIDGFAYQRNEAYTEAVLQASEKTTASGPTMRQMPTSRSS